jgi:hypothetical protein
MWHAWFMEGTKWGEMTGSTPGPAPGYLVGGPNTYFELDSCCTAPEGEDAYHCWGAMEYSLYAMNWEPPLNQPTQKSYLQFNYGRPTGSWPLTGAEHRLSIQIHFTTGRFRALNLLSETPYHRPDSNRNVRPEQSARFLPMNRTGY